MKDMLLIINPKAGQGNPGARLMLILDTLCAGGYAPTVCVTQARGDATRIAREDGGRYPLVACYGGDGTLDEVIAGLLAGGFTGTVGYVPAGSTNDFAYSLGLPGDARKAAQIMLDGQPLRCDVGSFGGQPFVYVAAFGAFTEVSYKTDQHIKNLLGHLAYLLEGARSLFNIHPYELRVETDDRVLEGRFIFGMMCNSRSVGGLRNAAGVDVALDDGLFEVVLVREPDSAAALERIISALTAHRGDDETVYFLKSRRLRVTGEQPVPWTLDGEDGGAHTEALIENRMHAVTILVPDTGAEGGRHE